MYNICYKISVLPCQAEGYPPALKTLVIKIDEIIWMYQGQCSYIITWMYDVQHQDKSLGIK